MRMEAFHWMTMLLLFALCIVVSQAFSVPKFHQQLWGIWKINAAELVPYESAFPPTWSGETVEYPQEILLQLHPNGSFRQCNEGYIEGRWLAGRWNVTEDAMVTLAFGRQYYGPALDVVLRGDLQSNDRTISGTIETGTFRYGNRHPRFWETPLRDRRAVGTFCLQQSLSTASLLSVDSSRSTFGNGDDDSSSEFFQ